MKKLLAATLIGVICGGCGVAPHEDIEDMDDASEVSFGWHAVGGGCENGSVQVRDDSVQKGGAE